MSGSPGNCSVLSPYTDHPGMNPSVFFPNHGYQIFTSVLSLIGISIVSSVFARRTARENLFRFDGWRGLSWPRLCVVLIFAVSWAFLFTAAVLISGTGLSLSPASCSLGIYSCIALYATTKILIYTFLIEKVWIVWTPRLPGPSGHIQSSRWSSPMYRVCMAGIVPYIVVVGLMVLGRIDEIRRDGACIIGLKQFASIPLLTYDLFITISLTCLFVYPLTRGDIISHRLRRIASRTLVASVVALLVSACNISVLAAVHGRQLGWVCLSSCGADVAINACVIYWVTGGSSSARVSLQTPASAPLAPQSTPLDGDRKGDYPLGTIRNRDGPGSPVTAVPKWRSRLSLDKYYSRDDSGLKLPPKTYSPLKVDFGDISSPHSGQTPLIAEAAYVDLPSQRSAGSRENPSDHLRTVVDSISEPLPRNVFQVQAYQTSSTGRRTIDPLHPLYDADDDGWPAHEKSQESIPETPEYAVGIAGPSTARYPAKCSQPDGDATPPASQSPRPSLFKRPRMERRSTADSGASSRRRTFGRFSGMLGRRTSVSVTHGQRHSVSRGFGESAQGTMVSEISAIEFRHRSSELSSFDSNPSSSPPPFRRQMSHQWQQPLSVAEEAHPGADPPQNADSSTEEYILPPPPPVFPPLVQTPTTE